VVRPPGPAGQLEAQLEAPGLTSSVPGLGFLPVVVSDSEPEKPNRSSFKFSFTNLLVLEVDDPTRSRQHWHDDHGSDDSDPPTAVARSDVFARAV
jgi:hypothetical protein